MDFKKVLTIISGEFDRHGVVYALIGGMALGLRGVPRATVDIDFLIKKEDAATVKNVLRDYGFTCLYESENAAQYTSELRPFGSIDFIYAFRPVSLQMLSDSEKLPVFDDTMEISVLKTEDIIGLKIQAIANNPERESIDKADIEGLLKLHGKEADWNKLKRYFGMFEMEGWYEECKKRFG